MRAILVLLALAALVLVALMSLGMISFQTTPGSLPKVKADVGSIDVTTTNKTIEVPAIEVRKADEPNTTASPAPAQ